MRVGHYTACAKVKWWDCPWSIWPIVTCTAFCLAWKPMVALSNMQSSWKKKMLYIGWTFHLPYGYLNWGIAPLLSGGVGKFWIVFLPLKKNLNSPLAAPGKLQPPLSRDPWNPPPLSRPVTRAFPPYDENLHSHTERKVVIQLSSNCHLLTTLGWSVSCHGAYTQEELLVKYFFI